MSRNIRQTAISGLAGSKRIIVAICGSVAMVMGAMSVGASMFIPQTSPELQQAASIPLFIDGRSHPEGTRNGASSPESSGTFTTQHALVANAFPVIPSHIEISKKVTFNTQPPLRIELGSVTASSGVVSKLQLKVDPSSLAPVVNVEIEVGTKPSTEDPTPPTEPETPATVEPEAPATDPTPPAVDEPVQTPSNSTTEDPESMSLFSTGDSSVPELHSTATKVLTL